jgi:hypothetical protein
MWPPKKAKEDESKGMKKAMAKKDDGDGVDHIAEAMKHLRMHKHHGGKKKAEPKKREKK